MPIDQRRPDAIAAAVATYNSAHPEAPLRRGTMRLLAVMFAADTVCRRSLDDLTREGVGRRDLSRLLRRMLEAGVLSKQTGSSREPNTYRLHLPLVRP